MYFSYLKLNNYGVYKGTHTIDFLRTSTNQNITLVGGLNGRGKTTLLESVFLVLFGRRAIRYLQDERISYEDYLRNHVNKSTLTEETYIELSLLFGDEAETSITINRHWTALGNAVNEELTVIKNGLQDKYLSDNWNYYVEEILPLGIARFFFFDNEKISQIADDDSYDKVKESIKILLGINRIDRLINDLQRLIKAKNAVINSSNDIDIRQQHSLMELENKLNKKIQREYSKICFTRLKLKRIGHSIEQMENEFWAQGGNLGFNKDKLVEEKNKLNDKLKEHRQQIIEFACQSSIPLLLCQTLAQRTYDKSIEGAKVHSLHNSIPVLKDLRTKLVSNVEKYVRAPEQKYTLLKSFELEFEDLFKMGLQMEEIPLSPSSQVFLAALIGNSERFGHEAMQLVNSFHDIDNQISQIDFHLNFEADKENVNDFITEIKKHTQKQGTLGSELKHQLDKLHTLEYKIKMNQSQQLQLLNQISTNENSMDDNIRLLKYANISIEIMSEFKTRLQSNKVKDLEQEIYECYKFMAQKETVIRKIHIDQETLDITLMDYQGGELLKSQLSAGEKQIFAVSILWGLSKCSGYRLPVIIDTPLGRLDSRHRTNFVTRYLPFASAQVIVLSTDEEIYGNYFSCIKPFLNSVYTLVYDENENTTSIVPGYFERGIL